MQQQLKETQQQLKQQHESRQLKQIAQHPQPEARPPKEGGVAVNTGSAAKSATSGGVASRSSSSPSLSPAIKSPAVKVGGGSLTANPAPRLSSPSGIGSGKADTVGKAMKLAGAGSPLNLGGGALGAISIASLGGGAGKGSFINNLASKLSKANASIASMTKGKSSSISASKSAAAIKIGSGKGWEGDAGGAGGGGGGNRTPVFARILANMQQQQKLISSVGLSTVAKGSGQAIAPKPGSSPAPSPGNGPVLLGSKQPLIHASVPQYPSPLHHASSTKATPTSASSSAKISSRTAAKMAQGLTNQTLVDHEELDVDVVGDGGVLMMELPAHLRDHAYSYYNPEEGEKLASGAPRSLRVTSSIPPSRVSYAPKVVVVVVVVVVAAVVSSTLSFPDFRYQILQTRCTSC